MGPAGAILDHAMRQYRAGEAIEDLCRACKIDRAHTVIATDTGGAPLRVQCDYCASQHNYRGALRSDESASGTSTRDERPRPPGSGPLPPVSERERAAEPVRVDDAACGDLEMLLRRVIREETGLTPAVPAEKWRGGTLILKPGNPDLQEKAWPVDTLFHKIVMIRNRLRMLEQQVNSLDVPEDVKIKIQAYITGAYGSLTSFNVLFADESDQFKGSGD
jgi:hypothetical protein